MDKLLVGIMLHVDLDINKKFIYPFHAEEIKRTLFHIGTMKAPGPERLCNTPFTPPDVKLVNEMSRSFGNVTTKFPCKFFF